MAETIDWPAPRRPRRRGRVLLIAAIFAVLFFGSTALSYYVDALWFDSLGYSAVFWKTLNLQAVVFTAFAAITFVVLYGSFLALKPPDLAEIAGGAIMINGQPVKLPLEPVLRLIALGVSLVIAAATGAGMMAEWPTLALYWYGAHADALAGAPATVVDPIFGHPLGFYLFTLPAWQLVAGWLMTLAAMVFAIAAVFVVITGGSRALTGHRRAGGGLGDGWRGLSIALAALLAMISRCGSTSGGSSTSFADHTKSSRASPTPTRT